jgi:hypothetical protein
VKHRRGVAGESESWASLGGERESRAQWEDMSSRSQLGLPTLVPHAGQGPGDWRQRWSWSRVGVRVVSVGGADRL